eukprot:scaffold86935_cov56-Attheya_sp.AAC.1
MPKARATTEERSVAELEERLAVLEMDNTMAPPPQAAYFLPQQPTFTFPQQPPPPTQIHVPQQQGWGIAAGGQRHTEGNAYRGKKPRQTGRGGRGGNGYNNDINMRTQQAYSNKQKTNLNLFYCYSCGYDVDHDGYNCPVN